MAFFMTLFMTFYPQSSISLSAYEIKSYSEIDSNDPSQQPELNALLKVDASLGRMLAGFYKSHASSNHSDFKAEK